MYSLLTEFRDGDNVVATMMEHNSNYVSWYAMCVESRAGCHCATLAHHALGLTPPASCRLTSTSTTPVADQ